MLDKIQNDLKEAQLSRDEIKVSTLRLLLSEIHNLEIIKKTISDQDIISVIAKEVKKRKEAIEAFRNGGREQQAQKEEAESKILEAYLPSQLNIEQLTKLIDDTINELGASSPSDMGKVMGMVMGKVAGRADGAAVSQLVKERLSHD